jgi:hypothetical protein
MMTPGRRVQKQITVAILFFIFWGLVGFGISRFFVKGPTCFDGIKNQKELAIDCGGPCKECMPELEKIRVLKMKTIRSTDTSFDFLAQVENPNREYGSSNFSYQFEAFDQSGNSIKIIEGSTYVLPSEIKYIIETPITLTSSPVKVTFSIKNAYWEKFSSFNEVGLEIFKKNYEEALSGSSYFSRAIGTTANKSNYDYDKVEVAVVLYDASGNIVNFGKTEQKTVLSGEEREFTISWKSQFKKPVKYEMDAYTNIFLNENFIKKHGATDKTKLDY